MIPKIIHYCWFGPNEMPEDQKKYIAEWKDLMPDFEFMIWTENEFNISKYPFAKQAYIAKKYAYVADYTRIYALHNFGGIYLDTDVKLNTSLKEFIKYGVFTSYEYTPSRKQIPQVKNMLTDDGTRKEQGILRRIPGTGLFSALIGSEKEHPFILDCLNYYDNHSFEQVFGNNLTVPNILAFHAEKYGFKYTNNKQYLENNIVIFDNTIFASTLVANSKSLAIHYCAASWVEKSLITKIKHYIYNINFVRNIINVLFPK